MPMKIPTYFMHVYVCVCMCVYAKLPRVFKIRLRKKGFKFKNGHIYQCKKTQNKETEPRNKLTQR